MYDDGNKHGTTVFLNRCSSEREIFREGNLIFHSISKENEERQLAPMSINGVKFITRVASCLAIFDRKPRAPAATLEAEPTEEPETPPPASERLALRLYPNRRIAMSGQALGIA